MTHHTAKTNLEKGSSWPPEAIPHGVVLSVALYYPNAPTPHLGPDPRPPTVDSSKSRIGVKKWVSKKNCTIKVYVSCICLRLAQQTWLTLTVSLFLCISGSNAQDKGPWRVPCQLKNPFKGSRRLRGSLQVGAKQNNILPGEGVIDFCFQKRKQQKNESAAWPGWQLRQGRRASGQGLMVAVLNGSYAEPEKDTVRD